MEARRYTPLTDSLFWIIFIPTVSVLIAVSAVCFAAPKALFVIVPVDLFTLYFLLSPLFGYAELRDKCLFIKYGFFMKREIPYGKIRAVEKERKFYCESMLALKNSFEHINVRYNAYDLTVLSVRDNDVFISELNARRLGAA